MRRRACVEFAGAFVALLALFGGCLIGDSAASKRWQTEIVKHGCGRWVVNDAGKTTFEWVEMCEGSR